VIRTVAVYKKCLGTNATYDFFPLDRSEHIGSPENVARTHKNILSYQQKVEDLTAQLRCYEAQAGD